MATTDNVWPALTGCFVAIQYCSSWRIAAELRQAQQLSVANNDHNPQSSTAAGDGDVMMPPGMMSSSHSTSPIQGSSPGALSAPSRIPVAVPSIKSGADGGAARGLALLSMTGDEADKADEAATAADDSPKVDRCESRLAMSVSAHHVGLFQFKGCGEVDVVHLVVDHWQQQQQQQQQAAQQAARAGGTSSATGTRHGSHLLATGREEIKGMLHGCLSNTSDSPHVPWHCSRPKWSSKHSTSELLLLQRGQV
jgi:hypothetical protein